MNNKAKVWLAAIVWLCPVVFAPAAEDPSPAMKPPQRVLFVGNSFTYYNGGLENHFRLLAGSAIPSLAVHADRATKGGATLKILQGLEQVHERIRDGRYDLVVLQEDIPELKEQSVVPFFEQARLFNQEIRKAGARTAFFMAWPYERLGWVGLEQIEQAHLEIGRELDASVAPVGSAFKRALQARPSLAMLGPDKEHETLHGTYLAANVMYSIVFGTSPEGLGYRPAGVSADEAAFLQGIAWATVQDWRKRR